MPSFRRTKPQLVHLGISPALAALLATLWMHRPGGHAALAVQTPLDISTMAELLGQTFVDWGGELPPQFPPNRCTFFGDLEDLRRFPLDGDASFALFRPKAFQENYYLLFRPVTVGEPLVGIVYASPADMTLARAEWNALEARWAYAEALYRAEHAGQVARQAELYLDTLRTSYALERRHLPPEDWAGYARHPDSRSSLGRLRIHIDYLLSQNSANRAWEELGYAKLPAEVRKELARAILE